MLGKKCSLCGGSLVNNRCTLCGLDNSVYDRKTSVRQNASQQDGHLPAMQPVSRTHPAREKQHADSKTEYRAAAQKQQTVYPKRQAAYSTVSRPAVSGSKNRAWAVWIIIIAVIIFAAIPALTDIGSTFLEDGSYSEDDYTYDYSDDYSDYDPYGSVTREIPAAGETYSTVLGNGIYRVGVHIPEGIYRAELLEGSGMIQIIDDENSIYYNVFFGTETDYDQVPEEGDIRLYNGAALNVDSRVILRFTTENAQPLTQTIEENPLSDPVSLEAGTYISGDETIPEGIYDITAVSTPEDEYGYSSVTLIYPNGSSEYLWVDSQEYAPFSDEYTDIGAKNIVIPGGTEVSIEYGSITLTPSDGYYNVDYTQYTSE